MKEVLREIERCGFESLTDQSRLAPADSPAFWSAAAKSTATHGLSPTPLLVISASAAVHTALNASGVQCVPSPLVGASCAPDRAVLAGLGCCTARDDGPAERVAYLTGKAELTSLNLPP